MNSTAADHASTILFVSQYLSRGGASRVTQDLIRFLSASGFRVAYALGSTRGHLLPLANSCAVYRFKYVTGGRWARLIPHAVELRLKEMWFSSVLRAVKPDLIYAVTLNQDLMRLISAASVPCVEHVHAVHLDSFTRGHQFIELLGSFADHYVASSPAVERRLLYSVGVPRERVSVLRNGIDVGRLQGGRDHGSEVRSRLGFRQDEVLVGAVGGLDFVKGPDRFLRVAAAVRDLGLAVPLRFLWIGAQETSEVALARGLRQLIAGLEAQGLVTFVPYADEIAPLLEALDILVVPSRAESLPLVMLEAMALSKPVVAFPVGSIAEVLECGGGMVTRGHDPAEMAKRVAELASDPELRSGIGSQARVNVTANHDSRELHAPFRELIVSVLAEHRRLKSTRRAR